MLFISVFLAQMRLELLKDEAVKRKTACTRTLRQRILASRLAQRVDNLMKDQPPPKQIRLKCLFLYATTDH